MERTELRTIRRIGTRQNDVIDMADLKKDDFFMMFEPDGTRIGDIWKADEDGQLNDKGVGAVMATPFQKPE